MRVLMSQNEATELAFRRDAFFPLKVLCWGALVVVFYAEHLWRAATLLIGSFICTVVSPYLTDGIGAGWLWPVFIGRLFLIAGVTWYATYALAWLSLPGWRFKLASIGAIIAFPFVFLIVGLVVVVAVLKLHLPVDPVLAFEDRYLPSWWRQSEAPKMNLDAAVRGELTLEQWESFDDSFKSGRVGKSEALPTK